MRARTMLTGPRLRSTSAAFVVAFGLIGMAACGSDAKNTKGSGTTDPSAQGTGTTGGNSTDTKSGGSGDTEKLPVQSANYTTGRLHLELSGGSSLATEIDGNGYVTAGVGLFNFRDVNRNQNISFAFNGSEGYAVNIDADGVAGVGEFGRDCTIDFTKGDASALEATFECTNVDAVQGSNAVKIGAKGTIKLAA